MADDGGSSRRIAPLAADVFAHGRVRLHILDAVIIHDAQVPLLEGCRDGDGNLRLGFDHAGAHFGDTRHHFLLGRHSGGAADFGLRLRDEFVGFGLLSLKFRTDVSPTSTSAISMERISNAVLLSSALSKTVLEMRSGFSSTSLYATTKSRWW